MKTEIIRFIVCIIFALLLVHVTVTPIVLSRYLNSRNVETIDYTTHYAKGDSINYDIINLINSEKYEEE